MKTKSLLFMMLFLLPFFLNAKSQNIIKLGANISSFRTEEGKSKLGLSLGLEKKYYPIQNFNGFFSKDFT